MNNNYVSRYLGYVVTNCDIVDLLDEAFLKNKLKTELTIPLYAQVPLAILQKRGTLISLFRNLVVSQL